MPVCKHERVERDGPMRLYRCDTCSRTISEEDAHKELSKILKEMMDSSDSAACKHSTIIYIQAERHYMCVHCYKVIDEHRIDIDVAKGKTVEEAFETEDTDDGK